MLGQLIVAAFAEIGVWIGRRAHRDGQSDARRQDWVLRWFRWHSAGSSLQHLGPWLGALLTVLVDVVLDVTVWLYTCCIYRDGA
jgi:hypothetical protein